MANLFRSIFGRSDKIKFEMPIPEKLLIRALEPRVLLDAAAVDTAVDMAGQAIRQQMADDYLASDEDMAGLSNGDDEFGSTDAPALYLENDEASPAEESLEQIDAPGMETPLVDLDSDEDDEVDIAVAPIAEERKEIVFIDSRVDNLSELLKQLDPNVEIHIIDANSDGVAQMAAVLATRSGIDTIHLISHGGSGFLNLGSTQLNGNSITGEHAAALAIIGKALDEDGDILIYGCNFGEGQAGLAAAQNLALVTGADIAASEDLTGHEELGGDWDLEVHQGDIESTSFALPDWEGLLDSFTLATNANPTVTHDTGGIIGTVGTTATWSNAGTITLTAGGTLNIDIRATVIGLSGSATATFATRSTTDPLLDDMRVVVTNTGAVTSVSPDGGDILEEGSATVLWEIFLAGTTIRPNQGSVSLTISDIDGRDGNAQTREALSADLSNLSSYTLQSPTNLQVTNDGTVLRVDGTQNQADQEPSWVQFSWNSANQLVLNYTTYTENAFYHHDGDGDLVFSNPNTQFTQGIDLDVDDSSGATGSNFQSTFIDSATPGTLGDGPAPIADADIAIFDINDTTLESATIILTNASAGDQLNVDTALLTSLGITATINTAVPGEITVSLAGSALIESYETAIQSITYSNVNNSFDQSYVRTISISASDGVNSTEAPTTSINFSTSINNPVALRDSYSTTEDTTITRTAGTGLLSNDTDPQGDTLNIVSAIDSGGNALTIGVAHVMPSGASLTLNADGSFTYIPLANKSGAEFIRYTVTDGVNTSQATATFNTTPVVDQVTLNLNLADNTSDEDTVSNVLVLNAATPDGDGSETVTVSAMAIPEGVIISDGTNSFTSMGFTNFVDISSWNWALLTITPVEHSDVDLSIMFQATSTEVDGTTSTTAQSVTFTIDAVADAPGLTVTAVGAPIGNDASLVGKINAVTIDADGSETITSYRLENIPAGAEILVNNISQTITGGTITLSPADLNTLVFRPPAGAGSYSINVFATSTESNPENGVTTLSAETGPIVLAIDIDNFDDPVTALDDTASTFAGDSVIISVQDNDAIPDGGPIITHVDGQVITVGNPVTLSGGQGSVDLNADGTLTFTASVTFSGNFAFDYRIADIDGSFDNADVIMSVQPKWQISGPVTTTEGSDAGYTISLLGQVQQGQSVSVDLALIDVGTTAGDREDIYASIFADIIANGRSDLQLIGTTLVYTAPTAPGYSGTYDAAGAGFFNITGEAGVTALNSSDDDNDAAIIGFDFSFFGTDHSSLFISSNGLITFGSGYSTAANTVIDGSAAVGRALIAPFWDDLDPSAAGDVYYLSTGSAGNRQFIVQWDGVPRFGGGTTNTGTFQVVLNEIDGSIVYRYNDVNFQGSTSDFGASASIGIQNASGQFYQHSFNTANSVADGSTLTILQAAQNMADFSFGINITDDTAFEIAEDYRIELTNANSAGINNASVTTTIAQNDNSAPVATDDALSVNENTTVSSNLLTVDLGNGVDSDPDGHTFTLTEINGAAYTPGVAFALPSGALITIATDGSVLYDPNGQYDALGVGATALDTFTYTIQDQFGAEDTATASVTIQGLNVTPTLDIEDDGTTGTRDIVVAYVEGSGLQSITDVASSIADVDDTQMASLGVTLGGFVDGGSERLSFGGQMFVSGTALSTTVTLGGTTFAIVYDGGTSFAITNNAGGDMANVDVELLIRSAQYEHTSANPTVGARTLDFVVNDGDINSNVARSTINLSAVNNAPTATDNSATVAEDGGNATGNVLTDDDGSGIDSDPEGDALVVGSATVDINGDGFQQALTLGTPTNITVGGNVIGALTLQTTGAYTFTPVANYNGSVPTITYVADDSNGGTDSAVLNITVTSVNDAPTLDIEDDGTTGTRDIVVAYVEGSGLQSITDAASSIADVDDTQMASLGVTLGGFVDGGSERLSFGGQLFVSGTALSTTVTLGGTVFAIVYDGGTSFAITNNAGGDMANGDVELLIRSAQYEHTSANPTAGSRTLDFVVNDGDINSNVARSTINLSVSNNAPTATDNSATFAEDSGNATGNVLTDDDGSGVDSDPEGDALVVGSAMVDINGDGFQQALTLGTPTNITVGGNVIGALTLQTTGAYTFTPVLNYNGSVPTITYVADDGNGGTDSAVLNITVTAVNDAPTATNNATTIAEDSGNATGNVITDDDGSGVDSDPEGDTLVVGSATVDINGDGFQQALTLGTPTNITVGGNVIGALTLQATGAYTFTPVLNYNGTLPTITYTLDDGNGGTDSAVLNITVTSVNDAPVATNNATTIAEDSGNATGNVITDDDGSGIDSDPEGDTLVVGSATVDINGDGFQQALILGTPTNITVGGNVIGALTLQTTGAYTFTPVLNYNGSVPTITYVADDGNGGTDSAVLNITVTSVNDAPTATDNATTIAEDSGNATGNVITDDDGNGVDSDPEGDPLTVASATVDINGDGFQQALTLGTPTNITVGGNVIGALTLQTTGAYTFTPVANYNGTLPTITYTLDDGNTGQDTATLVVTVTPVNDAPSATANNYTTTEDTNVGGNVITDDTGSGVDSDLDGDAVTLGAASIGTFATVQGGSITLLANGSFTYSPPANYNGPDSYIYTLTDGVLTDTATVSFTVTSVNDAPTATDNATTIAEDSGNATGNVINDDDGSGVDSDPEGDTLVVGSATVDINGDGFQQALTLGTPTNITVGGNVIGALTLQTTGAYTFTPVLNYNGSVPTITYVADDGNSGTDSAILSITVTSVNDAPSAADNIYGTNENTPVVGNVIADDTGTGVDSDVDGDAVTLDAVSIGTFATVQGGSITLLANGSFTYTPLANYSGPDSYIYTLTDGALTDTATVSFTVSSVNSTPILDIEDDGTTGTRDIVVAYAEGSGLQSVTDAASSIADVDDTQMASLGVTLGGFVDGGSERLSFGGQLFVSGTALSTTVTLGGTVFAIVYDGGTSFAITNNAGGDMSNGDVELLIRSAQYEHTSANPTAGSRTLDFVVNDGDINSNVARSTINLSVSNNAPTATDNSATIAEDGGNATGNVLTDDDGSGVDSDPEGDTLAVGSATVDINGDGFQQALILGTPTNITVGGNVIGALTLQTTGAYTFAPVLNYNGSVPTITYVADDGNGGTDSAVLNIAVTSVNDAPVATNNATTIAEDSGNATGNVITDDDGSGVDSDPEGDTLVVGSATVDINGDGFQQALTLGTPTNITVGGNVIGALTLQTTGAYTFTPVLNYNGTLPTITYTLDDGNGGSDSAVLNITVTAVNDAPTAIADGFVVTEDGSVTIDVLGNDNDPDGDAITISQVNGSAIVDGGLPVAIINGSVSLVGGQLVLVPTANYSGPLSFNYTVTDGLLNAIAAVTGNVSGVNDAPVASDNVYATNEDTPVGGNLINDDTGAGVDNDVDGDPLQIDPISVGTFVTLQGGSVTIAIDGTFTYTPPTSYAGPDSFSYTLTDGVLTDTAMVSLTISAVNDAPDAVDDGVFNVNEDTSLVITPLGNDSDPEGDTLTLIQIDGNAIVAGGAPVAVANGSVTLALDGVTLTFTPVADFNGPAAFTYSIDDGNGGQDTATININVVAINDAPIAVADGPFSVNEDGTISIDVIGNDSDPDGDAITISQVNGLPIAEGGNSVAVANGTVSLVGGQLVFTPDANYNGPASFNYTITDGSLTAVATVSGTVTTINDAPVALLNTYSTPEDIALGGNLITDDTGVGVDFDVDGDALIIDPASVGTFVTAQGGSVTINADGSFIYTPFLNFSGQDSFTYTVSDGILSDPAPGSIIINVNSTNDTPIATANAYSTNEDSNATGNLITDDTGAGVDTDPDGDPLSVAPASVGVFATTQGGSVTILGDGSFTYSPPANYVGSDTFTYTLTDGTFVDMATVTMTVNPVNDAPTAVADGVFNLNEDSSIVLTPIVDNDFDIDGDALTILQINGIGITAGGPPNAVANGSVSLALDGTTLTFTPNANYNGPAAFLYSIHDGNGGVDSAWINLNVLPVNDAPDAIDDGPLSVEADQTLVITPVTSNDVDIDFDAMTITAINGLAILPGGSVIVTGGVVTLALDQTTLSFLADELFSGNASFNYTITDGALTDTANVDLTVTPKASIPTALDDGPIAVLENNPVSFNPVLNDSDPNLDPLTIVEINGAAIVAGGAPVAVINGSVSLALDGVTVTFTPTAAYSGAASFDYTIDDGNGNQDSATVTLNVAAFNDAPNASNDNVNVVEDTVSALTITLPSDPDDVATDLTVTVTAIPAVGQGMLSYENGVGTILPINVGTILRVDDLSRVTFTPVLNFNGAVDPFAYTVRDDDNYSDAGSNGAVNITVTPVNDLPTAVNDGTYTPNEDNAIILTPVTDNDGDVDGDALTIAQIDGAAIVAGGPAVMVANGTVSLALDGTTLTFTPALNFNGATSFDYTVDDSNGGQDTATIDFNVLPVNDAPIAVNDGPLTSNEDAPFVFNPVTPNDTDVEGDALTISQINGGAIVAGGPAIAVANGTVSLALDGVTLTYVPTLNFNGPTNFTYTVIDGNGGQDTATVDLNVQPVNDAPVANNDGLFIINEDNAVVLTPITDNDTDIDGDGLSVATINGTAIAPGGTVNVVNGAVLLALDGTTLTFLPLLNYSGPASFDYGISDGNGGTDTATITLSILAVNDAPDAFTNTVGLVEDTPSLLTISLPSDVDDLVANLTVVVTAIPTAASGTLSYTDAFAVVSPVIIGTVMTVDDLTRVTFAPSLNFNGAAGALRFVVNDDDNFSDAGSNGTVNINVLPANDAPTVVAAQAPISARDGQTVNIPTQALFNDLDGDALTYTTSGLPGGLSIDPQSGNIIGRISSSASLGGSYTVQIFATDPSGAVATTSLVIDVTNVDPAGSNTSDSVYDGERLLISTRGLFTDPDGDALSYSSADLPSWLVLNSTTGDITGRVPLSASASGSVSFTIIANDGQGGVAVSLVTLNPFRANNIVDEILEEEEDETTTDTQIADEPTSPFLVNATEKFQDLNAINQLNGVNGIIVDTVQRINSLNAATDIEEQSTPVTDQVAAIDALSGLRTHVFDGSSEAQASFAVEGLSGFSASFNVGDSETTDGDRVGKLLIETFVRDRILYIDVSNSIDPDRDGRVVRYNVEMVDGSKLPNWIRIARDGFIIVERPVDIATLELKISAILENGDRISRSVLIDAPTGEIQPLGSQDATPGDFVAQLRRSIHADSGLDSPLNEALRALSSEFNGFGAAN